MCGVNCFHACCIIEIILYIQGITVALPGNRCLPEKLILMSTIQLILSFIFLCIFKSNALSSKAFIISSLT